MCGGSPLRVHFALNGAASVCHRIERSSMSLWSLGRARTVGRLLDHGEQEADLAVIDGRALSMRSGSYGEVASLSWPVRLTAQGPTGYEPSPAAVKLFWSSPARNSMNDHRRMPLPLCLR